jgi:hypothetical protein
MYPNLAAQNHRKFLVPSGSIRGSKTKMRPLKITSYNDCAT